MEMEIVQVQQPAAAPLPVMPAAANNNRRRRILLTVSMWAFLNAVVFIAVALIAEHTPCTKSTLWVLRCLALSDTAAAHLSALLIGGWCCVNVAELSAMLHMVLTTCCGCGGRWGVDALAWVALVATAGVHCTEVGSGSIALAAHPEDDTYFYVDVVLASIGLILDLLTISGLLCCWCSSRRRKLAEQGAGV